MLIWVLFGFVAIGAKLMLAALTIYLLLPTDTRCSRCDAETLLVRMNRGGRVLSALLRGRLQWRWCPQCGSEAATRRGGAPRSAPEPVSVAGDPQ